VSFKKKKNTHIWPYDELEVFQCIYGIFTPIFTGASCDYNGEIIMYRTIHVLVLPLVLPYTFQNWGMPSKIVFTDVPKVFPNMFPIAPHF